VDQGRSEPRRQRRRRVGVEVALPVVAEQLRPLVAERDQVVDLVQLLLHVLGVVAGDVELGGHPELLEDLPRLAHLAGAQQVADLLVHGVIDEAVLLGGGGLDPLLVLPGLLDQLRRHLADQLRPGHVERAVRLRRLLLPLQELLHPARRRLRRGTDRTGPRLRGRRLGFGGR
jgi:hypothetical protein